MVEPGRSYDNMAHAHCMLDKTTDTHSGYVILIAFPPQKWLKEHALCYVTSTLPVLFRISFRLL